MPNSVCRGKVAGVVLAAGAGRRMGRAKSLVVADDGTPWVTRAARLLRAAGADPVMVALGAHAERAAELVPGWASTVVVESWREGVGASLRESLHACDTLPGDVTALLVTLVDLPAARAEAARRILGPGWTRSDLRRATYGGKPGHPVLIGREHWARLAALLNGDVGARPYLDAYGAVDIDCTDIGGGEDVDTPAAVPEALPFCDWATG